MTCFYKGKLEESSVKGRDSSIFLALVAWGSCADGMYIISGLSGPADRGN